MLLSVPQQCRSLTKQHQLSRFPLSHPNRGRQNLDFKLFATTASKKVARKIHKQINLDKMDLGIEQTTIIVPPQPFKAESEQGQSEVILRRQFQDEDIVVEFSILPQEGYEDFPDEYEEGFEDEEDGDDEYEGGNGVAFQDDDDDEEFGEEDDDDEGEDIYDDDDDDDGFPSEASGGYEFTVSIRKKNQPNKELKFLCETVADEVDLLEMELKSIEGGEKEFTGPSLTQLSESLRKLLQKYLKERGVNGVLGEYINKTIAQKRQTEKALWLDKLDKFLA
eukprot:TRINITY_DN5052_c0_g1_i1.p1 TRINITY_DN5052_c0_g1~~TRINITY_DN5052_c0_g1_i1.p1  ORF type:complete len:279 (-),score=65.09 TRINITY_DN5052_c0_g1_i1:191-1027(-)